MKPQIKQKIAILTLVLTVFSFISYGNARQLMTSALSAISPKKIAQINVLTPEAPVKDILSKNEKPDLDAILKNVARQQLPKLIDYAGTKVPAEMLSIYKETDLKQTVKNTADDLRKMVLAGKIDDSAVEGALRDVFGSAVVDTAAFSNGLLDKYNLRNVALMVLENPKNAKEIQQAISQEIKNYAEQEMNKLANQALGTIFPVMQGVQLDFTDLSAKTLKSTLRSTIINAMAQSYLGPEYVAVYMAVSVVCPKCMQATHAELRRFDKKYLQPLNDQWGEEWDRFEDRLKAESNRVGKQIDAEINRLKSRVSAELNRQKQQVEDEANRAKEKLEAEFQRAQDSRIGKEVERQLNDISNESNRVIDQADAELNRELNDVANEANRLGKRAEKELKREVTDAQNELKRLENSTKDELKKSVKSLSSNAQKLKEKVAAELKRAESKVKAELSRVKAKLKKAKKKLGF